MAETNVVQPARTSDYRTPWEPHSVIAGRYTLREQIGEGGMGEVWVAKQSEPVKRRVALKLIKLGLDSQAVLQRFEHERQALAMMDHPNIAKVFDAGMTATGQPFFAMELVNGLPLDKFCDGGTLSIKERLELFVPICQAVQHAHQKGIVHRDLKPPPRGNQIAILARKESTGSSPPTRLAQNLNDSTRKLNCGRILGPAFAGGHCQRPFLQ